MQDQGKHVSWRRKYLELPYMLRWCPYHGYFVWRGRKGYELVDFSRIEKEAISIKPEPPDSKAVYVDFTIVTMKCPYCGAEWKQYKELPPESWGNIIYCPFGHEIPRDKAIK
jgi:hypothetical protein